VVGEAVVEKDSFSKDLMIGDVAGMLDEGMGTKVGAMCAGAASIFG